MPSKPTWNICQLGAVFFFNSSAYFTLYTLSQTIIDSIAEGHGINRHAGYYSGFLSYLIFTFGHFVATPIVEIISPKWSIIIGLLGCAMFEASFIWINEYFLYFAAAFSGFSGSLMWTGQFDYLAQNCQPQTLDRNSSMLWGISQLSSIFGGCFLLVLYRFQTGNDYPMSLVRLIVGSFLGFTSFSILIGCLLPRPCFIPEKYEIPYFKHLSEIMKMTYDRNILFLLSTFLYTGIEMSFFSMVYPTMISFTKQLGNTRDFIAISTIFVGFGNICGCLGLSILGERVRKIGRKNMVLLGAILHLTCFLMTFLTFPDEAPLKPTDELAFIKPRPYIVFTCSFLLGMGDTILNQQCYTILIDIYEHDKRIEAFAVYRFFQSASGCLAMLYSAHVLLRTHIIVLVGFCILATVTFYGIRIPKQENSGKMDGEEQKEQLMA